MKVLRLVRGHQTKKTSGVPTHPRGPVLSFFSPSPSSWSLVMRSGRTVRNGGEDRSWFGRPQAINKAAGNAATKGTYASKVLSFQQDHPPKTNSGAVVAVYELPKKGGSLIPPRTTHRPLTKGNETKMTEEIPMGRRRHDKKSLV